MSREVRKVPYEHIVPGTFIDDSVAAHTYGVVIGTPIRTFPEGKEGKLAYGRTSCGFFVNFSEEFYDRLVKQGWCHIHIPAKFCLCPESIASSKSNPVFDTSTRAKFYEEITLGFLRGLYRDTLPGATELQHAKFRDDGRSFLLEEFLKRECLELSHINEDIRKIIGEFEKHE